MYVLNANHISKSYKKSFVFERLFYFFRAMKVPQMASHPVALLFCAP